MVDIGVGAGRDMVALLSDMNQPLGHAVGNALEIREALAALRGGGPEDLREHCLAIGGHMVRLGRHVDSRHALDEAMAELADLLANGAALEKFRELVAAQGGDTAAVDDPDRLPTARLVHEIPAPQSGYVGQMNAQIIAQASLGLGAGRTQKSDVLDLAVGVVTHYKVGDFVSQGDTLFTVHANDETRLADAVALLAQAPVFRERRQQPLPTFYDTIDRPST
jgi:pyrimidine-nucleoside phosphorylase